MARQNDTDAHNPPPTPRAASSSSSLFAAFRVGLASRHTPGSPSNSSIASASRNAPDSYALDRDQFIPLAHDNAQPLALQNSVTSSMDERSLETQTTTSVIPGLKPLLQRLLPSNSHGVRNKAAKDIATLLQKYTGANVLQIWKLGQDLVNKDSSPSSHDAGYTLLIACVRHKRLTSTERQYFFRAIPASENPEGFALRFQVLKEITEDGKYLESLERFILPLLARLMNKCFLAAVEAKKSKTLTDEQENLDLVLDFLLSVIKQSSQSFTEEDLSQLISNIYPICLSTTSSSDIQKSIDIIGALVTYSCLPPESIHTCLNVLCGTYSSVRKLREVAWKGIWDLLNSHLGPATIDTLLQILKKNAHSGTQNPNVAKGAMQVLRYILKMDAQDWIPQSSLPKVVSAARQSMDSGSARIEMEAMNILSDLIESADPVPIIFHDKIWANAFAILSRASQREDNVSLKQTLEDGTEVDVTSDDILQNVINRLLEVTSDVNADQRRQVMRLVMQTVRKLDDEPAVELIEYLSDESLLYPFNDGWEKDFNNLFVNVFQDPDRSVLVRNMALHALYDAYNNGEALGTPDLDKKMLQVLGTVSEEKESGVVEDLATICTTIAVWTTNETTFDAISGLLEHCLNEAESAPTPASPITTRPANSESSPLPKAEKHGDSIALILAKALVKVFLRIINRSGWKAKRLFETFLRLAGSSSVPADARIMIFKVLFRMRADINHSIFLVANTDCEGIAESLCRTTDTMGNVGKSMESPMLRPSKAEDQMARRSAQGNANKTPARSPSTKVKSQPFQIQRPTPPLWLYPGPKGLPEDPPYYASHLICSCDETVTGDLIGNRTVLKIGSWLELLLTILQQDQLEWEIYSYILVHLGAQLMNHALFTGAIPQVRFLRNVICGQLTSKRFHEPPSFTGLKKSDVTICLYHILTMLVSYHEHFSSNEEADIVKIMTFGIGSWERTSEICIHGLSVCCHELPVAVVKAAENLLHKLSQIITQGQIAVHVLEFLATLARLPELFQNFRDEDFKQVFGICVRYLQYVRDLRQRPIEEANRHSGPSNRPGTSARETANHQNDPNAAPKRLSLSEDLPQYVYALTYHVMTFWFMALRLQDRPKYVPWITKNLMFTDPATGREMNEEQALVTLDLINRVMYSDRDETVPNPDFAADSEGHRTSKTWIIGMSLLTIETAARSGASQTIRRRPSSTRYSVFQPRLTRPPRHQTPIATGTAADTYYKEAYIGLTPDHILQEIYSPLNLSPATSLSEVPIPLPPDDPATARALGAFDRISPLDGHKIGIVYAGEAQTTESEILGNVMGSADYTAFLRELGTLTELKGANFNTQGLDREFDTDGKFTFCWRDRVSEIVFHVATMMPTNLEHDPNCMHKKKHIGNDFVNITFNNSGLPYKMDTIPSEFNYVNIVITPEARASFVETRLSAKSFDSLDEHEEGPVSSGKHGNPYGELHYLVSVETAPHIPPISPAPAAIPKLVSGKALPAFIRLVALNASVFSQVWANRTSAGGDGEHVSSWRSRLREIIRLREKYGGAGQQLGWSGNADANYPGPGIAGSTQMQPHPRPGSAYGHSAQLSASSNPSTTGSGGGPRESAVFRRPSAVNIFTGYDGANARDSGGAYTENPARLSSITTSSSNTNNGTENSKEVERATSMSSMRS